MFRGGEEERKAAEEEGSGWLEDAVEAIGADMVSSVMRESIMGVLVVAR